MDAGLSWAEARDGDAAMPRGTQTESGQYPSTASSDTPKNPPAVLGHARGNRRSEMAGA